MKNRTFLDFKVDNFTEAEVLDSFLAASYKFNIAFASWKLPGQKIIHIILGTSKSYIEDITSLESLSKGFLISPFINESDGETIFIKADIYYNSESGLIKVFAEHEDSGNTERIIKIIDFIQEYLELSEKVNTPRYFQKDSSGGASTTKEAYLNIVNKAIDSINEGKFDKVVLSKKKEIVLTEGFNIVNAYLSLSEKYLNAFVSLICTPQSGTWIGATPETLIKVDANKIFYTESLAGTQQFPEDSPLSEVAWTQKEIEEQALVSRYIINSFKKIRLREFEEIGPKTIVAGNLVHLKTIYRVDMEATGFPDLGSTMLKLLHPTSAVCGMPKEPAMEFILEHETYNRSYYSGYLGPVHFESEIHIFVNLRCLQLNADKATLYAGAGILGNSNPEKEWRETEIKCDTLIDGMNL